MFCCTWAFCALFLFYKYLFSFLSLSLVELSVLELEQTAAMTAARARLSGCFSAFCLPPAGWGVMAGGEMGGEFLLLYLFYKWGCFLRAGGNLPSRGGITCAGAAIASSRNFSLLHVEQAVPSCMPWLAGSS